jgi:DNA-binding MarR family transcriptional regulator
MVTTRRRKSSKPADVGGALVELHRAANAVRHHVEQAVLRHKNLSWTGFVVLREVWLAEGLETREAAVRAGIAKATLTGVANTLVDRGLLRRVRHPEDGRLVLLQVTARGNRLLRDLLPVSQAEEAFTLGHLDDTQINHVHELMSRLVVHLDGDEAQDRRA